MKLQKHRLTALLSGLLAILCVVGSTQAAQANGASADEIAAADWTPYVNPLHAGEGAYRDQTTAQRNSRLERCGYGYACIAVGQGDGLHTVFVLFQCDTRTLINFINAGAIKNNQWDDARVRFTGDGVIATFYPDPDVKPFDPYPYDTVDPC